jgi:hypothetical protein
MSRIVPVLSHATTTLLLLALAGAASAGPELSPSGIVVDPERKPVSGAKACLIVGGAEGLCNVTGDDGRYALPASASMTVRIAASGFLPISVAAIPQASPIVLERAAALAVLVVDAATGEGVAAEVTVVYTTGRQLGPFPANRAGLALKTLPAGEVRVLAKAENYADGPGEAVTLVRGKKSETRVLLVRKAPALPAQP